MTIIDAICSGRLHCSLFLILLCPSSYLSLFILLPIYTHSSAIVDLHFLFSELFPINFPTLTVLTVSRSYMRMLFHFHLSFISAVFAVTGNFNSSSCLITPPKNNCSNFVIIVSRQHAAQPTFSRACSFICRVE